MNEQTKPLVEIPDNIVMPKWLKDDVVVWDWCFYKGEKVFGCLNWGESEKRQKPIIDICYCATKALNGIVLKQRVWNKNFNYVK